MVAFFDADSTLRCSKSGSPTANAGDDVNVLPFVASAIRDLNAQGYLVAVVSNQGGVAAGYTDFEVAEDALVYVGSQLSSVGAKVDYLDFADQKDEYRKPNTGMGTHLEGLLQSECGASIDWAHSFMVGDAGYKKDVDGPHPDGRPADDFSNSDRGFAENLGIPFSEPTDYFGWRDWGFYNIRYQSQLLGFYGELEAEIDTLDASGDDPERREWLAAEIAENRTLNGL
jgi:bifunctional polynucleotide phosphatase/kinase